MYARARKRKQLSRRVRYTRRESGTYNVTVKVPQPLDTPISHTSTRARSPHTYTYTQRAQPPTPAQLGRRDARGPGALARRVSGRAPPRSQPHATARRAGLSPTRARRESVVATRDAHDEAAIAAAAARPRAARSPAAHAEHVGRLDGLLVAVALRR